MGKSIFFVSVACCMAITMTACSKTGVTGSPKATTSTVASGAATNSANEAIAAPTSHKPAPLGPVASISDGATGINPTTPVTVKAVQGDLVTVVMTNESGKVVKSHILNDKKTWKTDEVLGYSKTYTIEATSSNGGESTITFDTLKPAALNNATITPINNSVVGVGQVVQFHFGQPVQDRAKAQKPIKITTNPPVEGAFFWLSPTELRWRPEHFWKPGTKVHVETRMYGKDLGDGVWGGASNSTTFTIGDKVIAVADDNTKQITVSKNDKVVKTFPTSMGQPKYPTPVGIYTIGDLRPDIIMDSSTFGVPVDDKEGYRAKVLWASQMSYSGIYLHAAPWSLWAQGHQDVSHGCLNVSTANAEWFQKFVKRGDIVIVKNTGAKTLNGYDGLGDWNIDWKTWKAGNANG